MIRTIALLFAFLIGGFFPELSKLQVILPFLIIYMLVPVFLSVEVNKQTFDRSLVYVLIANAVLPFFIFEGLRLSGVDEKLALAAFFTALTPTATGAPVIVSLIGGNVSYVVLGFILSLTTMSLVLLFSIPFVLPNADTLMILSEVGRRIFIAAILPAAIAMPIRWIKGKEFALKLGKKLAISTFYCWIMIVVIVAATAIEFVRTENLPLIQLLHVGYVCLGIAILFFSLGYFLGKATGHQRECSQLLGQKNTSYTIYLALAISPIAALGPAFYVFFHNTWNGIQIGVANRKHRKLT